LRRQGPNSQDGTGRPSRRRIAVAGTGATLFSAASSTGLGLFGALKCQELSPPLCGIASFESNDPALALFAIPVLVVAVGSVMAALSPSWKPFWLGLAAGGGVLVALTLSLLPK